jgi:nitrite reductase/ring-hydroxylating ferredoxin subunit
MSYNESYVEVAKVNEIPSGKMKHVELKGKEIVISNVNGKYYAMDDRCGHMNALLSMGTLSNDNIMTPMSIFFYDII